MTIEGKAVIDVREQKIPTKDMPVFYNTVMKFNRDVSIELIRAMNKKNLVIADPLAGSGVRAIRMLKELPKGTIKKIYANDKSLTAVNGIKNNLKKNKITNKVIVSQKDARDFMRGNKFDYVDIDPFGYPGYFIEQAIKSTKKYGILAITATDTAALCGSAPKACKRKYLAENHRNWMMHELGLRILIGWAARKASEQKKSVRPMLSYSRDHYMRTFLKIGNKKKQPLGMIWLCTSCCSFGKGRLKACKNCGKAAINAGPLWTGKIGDERIVRKVSEHLADKKFLFMLSSDTKSEIIGFYDINELAGRYKLPRIPPMEFLLGKIDGTRTHFNFRGIKTKKNAGQIARIIRQYALRQ